MARRKRSPVPAEVPVHQPVIFSDSYDSSDVPEDVSPRGVPLLSDSAQFPPRAGPRAFTFRIGRPGVWGGTPQAKQRPAIVTVRAGRAAARTAQGRFSIAKRLFNQLSVAFPRRDKFCKSRATRRSVLFALRKRGVINRRSPGGAGGYRRTQFSQWRC